MPLDPALIATDPAAKAAGQIADLERRLRNLERGQATIQTGDGAPTVSAATMRDGTPYLDETNSRLYVVVNSVWKYAALT